MSSPEKSSNISSQQNQNQTKEQLFAQIERSVQSGDFGEAEQLRERLLEVAPMAISEAIKAAELIEDAMAVAIDQEHVNTWPLLYESLSQEQKNCLFHSLKSYKLPENRLLLQYGALNNRLFFIERGEVVVAVPQGEGKKLKAVARLGKGDVLGEYSFATIALCSASAITKTAVQLRCLEGETAESWSGKHPGLYDKVLDFCRKYGSIDQIAERKAQEIHPNPRFSISGLVKATLLDGIGQDSGLSFNGDVEEISRSGCSFAIHCNQKEIVKKMLTRSFELSFSCSNKGKELVFSSVGKVAGVTALLHNDYLIHIGFENRLPEEFNAQFAS